MVEHTVEVYKSDNRVKRNSKSVQRGKNKIGLRFIDKIDFDNTWSLGKIQEYIQKTYPRQKKFMTYVHETYVTRVNLMSGKEFKERYDTPIFCSPAFESYWSM